MALITVKKEAFDFYRFGKKDIVLREMSPQWMKSKVGDIATIQCENKILIKKIVEIYEGSIAKIFSKVHYKRVFPEASTIFEAVTNTKKHYHGITRFVAFQIEDFPETNLYFEINKMILSPSEKLTEQQYLKETD